MGSVGNVTASRVLSQQDDVKLRKAAREFEAMLIADLMKMADSEKEGGDAASQSYGDMRVQAVAQGLAQQGGSGIGQMLVNQLHGSRVNQGEKD